MAGRAGALRRIAEADAVQVHRVADPERAEDEDVVAARDRFARGMARVHGRIARRAAATATCSPSGTPSAVVLLPSTPASPLRIAAGPSAGGPSGFAEIAGPEILRLRDVQARLESDDRIELLPPQAARASPGAGWRVDGLRAQASARAHPPSGSSPTGRPVSGSREAGRPFLPMNGSTPKFSCVVYFVFATGRGRR